MTTPFFKRVVFGLGLLGLVAVAVIKCSGGVSDEAPLVSIPAPEARTISISHNTDQDTDTAQAVMVMGANSTSIGYTVKFESGGNSTTAAAASDGSVPSLTIPAAIGDTVTVSLIDPDTEDESDTPLSTSLSADRVSGVDLGEITDFFISTDEEASEFLAFLLGNDTESQQAGIKTIDLTGNFTAGDSVMITQDGSAATDAQSFVCIADSEYCVVLNASDAIWVVNRTTGVVSDSMTNSLGNNGKIVRYANTAYLSGKNSDNTMVSDTLLYVTVDTSTGDISTTGTIALNFPLNDATVTSLFLAMNEDRPSLHVMARAVANNAVSIVTFIIDPLQNEAADSVTLEASESGNTLEDPVAIDVVPSLLFPAQDLLFIAQSDTDATGETPLFRARFSILNLITDVTLLIDTDGISESMDTLASFQGSGTSCGEQAVLSLAYTDSRLQTLYQPSESATESELEVESLGDGEIGLSADATRFVCVNGDIYSLTLSTASNDLSRTLVDLP